MDLTDEDMLLLEIIYPNCTLQKIKVRSINVRDYFTCDYDTKEFEYVYTFVCNNTSTGRENRHNNCGNLTKYLLI